MLAGVPGPQLAASFHDTLAAATAELVRAASREHGRLPVVLTGGCFQNARLAEGVLRELDGALSIFLHRDVPPGDGGLALGQALVADAVARGAS
jgi:hydrogenase maturation protein HypF